MIEPNNKYSLRQYAYDSETTSVEPKSNIETPQDIPLRQVYPPSENNAPEVTRGEAPVLKRYRYIFV